MEKRLFLFLIVVGVIYTTITAKQRTKQEIKQCARLALANTVTRRAVSANDIQLDVIQSNKQLTIVGGKVGFAVIANDDQFPAVLGYSEKQVVTYMKKLVKEFKKLPYDDGVAMGFSMIEDDTKLVEDAYNEAVIKMRENKSLYEVYNDKKD